MPKRRSNKGLKTQGVYRNMRWHGFSQGYHKEGHIDRVNIQDANTVYVWYPVQGDPETFSIDGRLIEGTTEEQQKNYSEDRYKLKMRILKDDGRDKHPIYCWCGLKILHVSAEKLREYTKTGNTGYCDHCKPEEL